MAIGAGVDEGGVAAGGERAGADRARRRPNRVPITPAGSAPNPNDFARTTALADRLFELAKANHAHLVGELGEGTGRCDLLTDARLGLVSS